MGVREALTRTPGWVRWLLALVPIRIAMIPVIPILPEEAYHWNFARHLDWGYYDHPPMIAWAIAAGRAVFGDNALGIRAVTVLFSYGTSIVVARMAERFYGEVAAVWAVILFTFVPVALPVSGAGFPDSPLLFFWALTLSLAWKAIEGQDGSRWLAAGAALGAALLSKYTAVFLVPSVFVYLVLSKRDRRWLATPWPYLAGLVALLVFTPVLYWNWKHEWASFLFQTGGRFREARGAPGRPGRFLLSQALAVLPLTLPLAAAAALRLSRTSRSEEQFFRACVWPILLGFWAVSWIRPAHVLWPLPGYLGLIVVMAGEIGEGTGRIGRFYARVRGGFVAFCGVGLLALGFHLVWFLPWVAPLQGPYGWEQVAAGAREIERSLPESSFYLALGRKYTVASQLAYHLKRPYDVHGANLVGEPALQYGFWCSPRLLEGRDAVIVIEDEIRMKEALSELPRFFASVEPAGKIVVPIGRSPIHRADPPTFYLFKGHGYRPPPAP
jgi:dolichol-phosphate mannosyltransferase